MTRCRIVAVVAGGLLLTCAAGCAVFESGPSDQELVAAVKKSPPSAPTVGPTYLAVIEAVEVQQRGRYNADGKYWPVRARVKGGVKIRLTNVFQLGLLGNARKIRPSPWISWRKPASRRTTSGLGA